MKRSTTLTVSGAVALTAMLILGQLWPTDIANNSSNPHPTHLNKHLSVK